MFNPLTESAFQTFLCSAGEGVTLSILRTDSKLQSAHASHELVCTFRSRKYNEIFWATFDAPNYWEHASRSFPGAAAVPCRYCPGSLVPCTAAIHRQPRNTFRRWFLPKNLVHLEGKVSAWHDSYSHPTWRPKTPLMGAESFPVWTAGLKLEQGTLKQGSQASPSSARHFSMSRNSESGRSTSLISSIKRSQTPALIHQVQIKVSQPLRNQPQNGS